MSLQKKLSELATYLERELDSKPHSEHQLSNVKTCTLNQRLPVVSAGGKFIKSAPRHRSSADKKIKSPPRNSASTNESTCQSSPLVTSTHKSNSSAALCRVVDSYANTDFSRTSDSTCQTVFSDMEKEFDLLKTQNLELLERCRVLENELCRTIDENYRLTQKRQQMTSIISKIHDGVTAEKTRLHSMREGIVLGLAGFMQDLDRLKCEQEHFIEELKLAKEKVKENRLEKTLLENQSVVIDDLTAEVESLRTTNTDLENELKRVTLAHEEGARRLHGKVTMMEHEFTGRIARLERHVDEGCKTEKFDAHFKDIAQIVEDLKALKVNVEAQQSLFKEAVTQMQSRHENILRQMEENRQNSTKDLFKVIQEEDQRMCRLREELGLCGDLENKWRERIKDSLLGDMDESVLTAGIRRQLEETITALHATIKTLKRRSMTLEKENMRLQALLLRRDEESNLTNKIHLPNTSGNYGAYQ